MRRICGRMAVVVAAGLLAVLGMTGSARAESVAHRCQNFGGTSTSGHVAGHCVDVFRSRNVDRDVVFMAQGQAFCRKSSDLSVYVRCAEIRQTITVRNLTSGGSAYYEAWCGPGSACPVGRFQNYSPGLRAFCQNTYRATVLTRIGFTGGGLAESRNFSIDYTYGC